MEIKITGTPDEIKKLLNAIEGSNEQLKQNISVQDALKELGKQPILPYQFSENDN